MGKMDGANVPAPGYTPADGAPPRAARLTAEGPFHLATLGPFGDLAGASPTAVLGLNPRETARGPSRRKDSYLVDSASSHMLVSKIKPCMSKYKQLYGETANGSLNQLSFI